VTRQAGGAGVHGPNRYRIVVEGEVSAEWGAWLGAEAVRTGEGRTTLDVMVADQAELHGLLRRIHDLHLPIASMTRE
jgi:hypothetical protein